MTFAELVFALLVIVGLYYSMKPVRLRLESYFTRLFRSKKSKKGSVIDVTDYTKKDEDKNGKL